MTYRPIADLRGEFRPIVGLGGAWKNSELYPGEVSPWNLSPFPLLLFLDLNAEEEIWRNMTLIIINTFFHVMTVHVFSHLCMSDDGIFTESARALVYIMRFFVILISFNIIIQLNLSKRWGASREDGCGKFRPIIAFRGNWEMPNFTPGVNMKFVSPCPLKSSLLSSSSYRAQMLKKYVENVKEYDGKSPPSQNTEPSEVRVVKAGMRLGIIQSPSSYIQAEKFRVLSIYRLKNRPQVSGKCLGHLENFESFLYI